MGFIHLCCSSQASSQARLLASYIAIYLASWSFSLAVFLHCNIIIYNYYRLYSLHAADND